MTRDDLEKLPRIALPAPWAAGVVLGLVDQLHYNHPPGEPGLILAVEQGPGRASMRDQLAELGAVCRRRCGASLYECVTPWTVMVQRGLLGWVRIKGQMPSGQQGWLWQLTGARALGARLEPPTGGLEAAACG